MPGSEGRDKTVGAEAVFGCLLALQISKYVSEYLRGCLFKRAENVLQSQADIFELRLS